jgi:hypothetical protein
VVDEFFRSRLENELDTPTIARVLPMKMERWNSFSATNASQSEAKLAYIRLNIQTPCPPRGAVPVNQRRTWEVVSLCSSFWIAFGDGCDYPAMSPCP